MRILYLNIYSQSGGILQKFDLIEQFAMETRADILTIAEAELPANHPIPVLEGFSSARSCELPSRLVTYTRSSITANVSIYESGLPGLAIHTAQSSFGFLYSPYTVNVYNPDSSRLSDKERRVRVLDYLDWFNNSAKVNSYILGDTNIDWTNKSNFSRRAIATWCLDARFSQMVNNPTRLSSILDYCLVRSNKASNAIKCEVIDSGFRINRPFL